MCNYEEFGREIDEDRWADDGGMILQSKEGDSDEAEDDN